MSLKLKLKVFKAGHMDVMLICYIKRMTANCLPMIGHFYHDCIIVASLVKQWQYSSFKV